MLAHNACAGYIASNELQWLHPWANQVVQRRSENLHIETFYLTRLAEGSSASLVIGIGVLLNTSFLRITPFARYSHRTWLSSTSLDWAPTLSMTATGFFKFTHFPRSSCFPMISRGPICKKVISLEQCSQALTCTNRCFLKAMLHKALKYLTTWSSLRLANSIPSKDPCFDSTSPCKASPNIMS